MASTDRVDRALAAIVPKVATWFGHSVTPDKPLGPSTASLTAPDLDRFNQWVARREFGSVLPGDLDNMTPELAAVVASYEVYFATPQYAAWAATDNVSREMQWRLWHVDVAEAVDVKGTVPPVTVSSGIGSDAPTVDEITVAPTGPEMRGEMVSSGGKSPEIVFGDDGDIVTTGV